jgi:hypothetical protein
MVCDGTNLEFRTLATEILHLLMVWMCWQMEDESRVFHEMICSALTWLISCRLVGGHCWCFTWYILRNGEFVQVYIVPITLGIYCKCDEFSLMVHTQIIFQRFPNFPSCLDHKGEPSLWTICSNVISDL